MRGRTTSDVGPVWAETDPRRGTTQTRRRLVLSGAAGGGVGLLTVACGTGGAVRATDAAATPSKGPVSLTYFHTWSNVLFPLIEQMLADFTKGHPTVKAEHVRTGGDLHEEFATKLAAGSPPDVTMLSRTNMPGLVAKDALTVLDPYMRRDKLDAKVFYDGELRSSQFLGRTYVLPAATAGAWYLIYWNRDYLREAGPDPAKAPATWDELTRYARTLTKTGPDGKLERLGFEAGSKESGSSTSFFTAFLYANGGRYATDDGRKLLFASPEGDATLDWMTQALKQIGGPAAYDEFWPRSQKGHQALLSGERAIHLRDYGFLGATISGNQPTRFGVGRLPLGTPKGAPGIVRGGWSFGVPKAGKALSEAWLLTQYLGAAPEGAGRFMREQQGRPSAVKSFNDAGIYGGLPQTEVIKQALATDAAVPATPADTEIDKLTVQAVTDVLYKGRPAREALQFAQAEGQRQLDAVWASIK